MLQLNMAEILTVLVVSTLVTLLFDLPMQEVKSILMGDGKQCTRQASCYNSYEILTNLCVKLLKSPPFFLKTIKTTLNENSSLNCNL